jgi:hypothetical protein
MRTVRTVYGGVFAVMLQPAASQADDSVDRPPTVHRTAVQLYRRTAAVPPPRSVPLARYLGCSYNRLAQTPEPSPAPPR